MFGQQSSFSPVASASTLCSQLAVLPEPEVLSKPTQGIESRQDRQPAAASALEPSIVSALARTLKPFNTEREGIDRAVFIRSAGGKCQPSADFCDSFALDNGAVALVVGDVSGHDSEAAARVPEIRAMIRLLLYANPDPAQALNDLNTALCRTAKQNADSWLWFVCVAVAVIDPITGLGQYACGGAEPPMIVATSAMHRSLPVGGFPLGLFEDAGYSATQYALRPSDLLIIATDGIFEAGRPYRPLGSERFLKWANGLIAMHSLKVIGQMLMDEIESFARGEMADDAALLLARLA